MLSRFTTYLLIIWALAATATHAQPTTVHQLFLAFASVDTISNPTARDIALDEVWNTFSGAPQYLFPFTSGDSAMFLYRGAAASVDVNGDFNQWGSNGSVPNSLSRFDSIPVWYIKYSFPPTARLDYKFVIDESNWILDPVNPNQQWGGFGPNSELRMSAYEVPPETIENPDAPKGSISGNIRISSSRLGYDLQYRVYTPAFYNLYSDFPLVIFTDGQEYLDDRLGHGRIVLDNLFFSGATEPFVAVFLDARNPDNLSENRRMNEFVNNADFGNFIAQELIPDILNRYRRISHLPQHRALIGTSLGGYLSAYMAVNHSSSIQNFGLHSPALWVDDTIITAFSETESLGELKFFISTGTFFDGMERATALRDTLVNNSYDVTFAQRDEGHSWGQWKGLIDDALIHFFENVELTGVENDLNLVPSEYSLSAYPNPFNPQTNLVIQAPVAETGTLEIYSMDGRNIQHLSRRITLQSGRNSIPLDFSSLASGIYLIKVQTETIQMSRKITLLR